MVKSDYPYAVVVSYSFDDTVSVYPCASEDQAKDLLKKFFETEVEEDKAQNHEFEHEITDDGWAATITNYRKNGDVDYTWWKIGSIDGKGSDFL